VGVGVVCYPGDGWREGRYLGFVRSSCGYRGVRITRFSTASGAREWATSRVVMWRLLGGMSQRSGWGDQLLPLGGRVRGVYWELHLAIAAVSC